MQRRQQLHKGNLHQTVFNLNRSHSLSTRHNILTFSITDLDTFTNTWKQNHIWKIQKFLFGFNQHKYYLIDLTEENFLIQSLSYHINRQIKQLKKQIMTQRTFCESKSKKANTGKYKNKRTLLRKFATICMCHHLTINTVL